MEVTKTMAHLDIKTKMTTAMNSVKQLFPILEDKLFIPDFDSLKFSYMLQDCTILLREAGIQNYAQDLIILKVKEILRKQIVPQFWQSVKDNSLIGNFFVYVNTVETLFNHFNILNDTIMKHQLFLKVSGRDLKHCLFGEENVHQLLIVMLKGTLLSQMPINHQVYFDTFYGNALKMRDNIDNSTSDCLLCTRDPQACSCSTNFKQTNKKLESMCLLEPLLGQSLNDLTHSFLHSHVKSVCKDSFDVSYIQALEEWIHTVVISWLKESVCNNSSAFIMEFEKKLLNDIYMNYTLIRIDQLFNIIIEYPDSLPALEDLRTCLQKTDLKAYLIRTLKHSMECRLLHPGVNTNDVLTAYIATIRSLKVLDPSGLLLETIAHPIHRYLRSREDTVRCVVSSLIEEGPNDLAEEFGRVDTLQLDEDGMGEDLNEWETWTPDPVHPIMPSATNTMSESTNLAFHRTSDIISMLVNVYGSKDLFVNEYRTLLADRLLSQYSCDTEKEIRYLELLKLRFGESQLHFCEVMLKDVADSKRINQHIKSDTNYSEQHTPLSAMIVSAQFWPPFKEETLQLHPTLAQQLKIYTKCFETLKGNRTLHWKHHLGVVDLEIELDSGILSLAVSPIHATILMHFQDKKVWSLEELSKTMLVPPTVLRRKIQFWMSHRLIVEKENEIFHLQEDGTEEDDSKKASDDLFVEDFESESALASAQDQRDEELQTFWSYIVGMLMNLDSLPLDRIYQMLKMFAFNGPSVECTLQELKLFLDSKVREHKLVFSNNLYRLPK